jgi:alpha-ribazole phosphatase
MSRARRVGAVREPPEATDAMPHAPTIIYLIRHGQTAWNVEEVFRGRTDVPLDQRGRDQARAAAAALADQPLSAVYSGPLQRAHATAIEIAAPHDLQVRIDERFTDLHFGDWEGKPLTEVRATWPDLFARWERDPGSVVIPRGESLPVVRERAGGALEELAAREAGETIAVVSHRVVTKVLICHILGLDNSRFWQIRQDTACVNRIEWSGAGWVLARMNDLCHLHDLRADRGRDF